MWLVLLALLVGVVAQLVAVAQILDHLARETGKGGLIRQHPLQAFERIACLALDEGAPQIRHRLGPLG